MKKIVLLNFPWAKLYIRDYYCSKVSKADYVNAPIDLVILSWILNDWSNQITLIDWIIDKLSSSQILKQIADINPDYIIWLIWSVSLNEDKIFLKELIKNKWLNCELFLTWDILQTEWDKFLTDYNEVKWVIISYFSKWILSYINRKFDEITDMTIKFDWEIKHFPKSIKDNQFEISLPIHEQFITKNYRMPFVRNYPFATTLMTYWCPFQCSFCIMNTLTFKERTVENMVKELDYLKSLWVKEILFLDQTIAINKANFKKLLNIMIEKQYNFWWFWFSRVDVMDEDTLKLCQKSWCHTLWFWIESWSQFILDKYRKWYKIEQIKKTFTIARWLWIKTLATFLLWLPEETFEMANKTIEFAKEIDPDFASFNFAVPRFWTSLREEALQENLIDESMDNMDQSWSNIAMHNRFMTKKQIESIKRKAIIWFYFRPKYILRRLLSLRSYAELKSNINNAFSLLRNII